MISAAAKIEEMTAILGRMTGPEKREIDRAKLSGIPIYFNVYELVEHEKAML